MGRLRPGGVAIIVAASLMLTSCTNSGLMPGSVNSEPLSPAQQQLKQANSRFVQTTAQGALLGAALGVGLGLLLGGSKPGTAIALGAAAGALAGAGTGYAIARRNYERAQTEDNLQKSIAESQSDADAYAKSADASITIANEARVQLASLNAELAAKSINTNQYRRDTASYHESADIMHKQIVQMQSEVVALRADAATTNGNAQQQMLANAQAMDQSREVMERNVGLLETALAAEPSS